MQVSTLQYVLIAVFYGCVQGFVPISWLVKAFNSPIVIGWVIGIILGDPLTGAITGALINMIYLGTVSVGGVTPSNKVVAATVGVAFVMLQGLDPEASLVIAVPVGVALATLQNWMFALNLIFANMADRYFYEKKWNAAGAWFLIGGFAKIVLYGGAMFIVLKYGIANITFLTEFMPDWLANGMAVAAAALPAVGLALGMKPLAGKGTVWYTLISFVLVYQLGFSVTTMVVIGVGYCALVVIDKMERGEVDFSGFRGNQVKTEHIITQNDAIAISVSLAALDSYINNSVKYCGDTLMHVMRPILKKLYPNDEDRQVEEASKYDCYFTTAVALNGVITAPVMLMEEERAKGNEEVTPETINAYIAGTMGPVSAVGDPLCQAVINTIFISIGIGIVNSGSAWGAGVAMLGMLIANIVMIVVCPILGYRVGTNIIDNLFTSGIGNLIAELGGIIGSIAFGALAASYVGLSFGGLTFAGVTLQTDLIDKILPGLLPISLLLGCYYLLKKNKVGPLALMLIVFGATFVLGAIGILG